MEFYEEQLVRFLERISSPYWKIPREELTEYLNSIPGNQWGCSTRHAAFRVLRAFYRWLRVEYDLPDPTAHLRAPRIGKPILPTLTREQVEYLLEHAGSIRDKAIIALLTESGLRLSELANIKPSDIDWQARTVRAIGKGRKEALAPFGSLTEGYLREWLSQYSPNGTIWDIDVRGIQIMLTRLKQRTGLPCNPHTFRRTFAVLLRKAGVDCLTIKELGRWESVAMVERYTRSVSYTH
ncbi:MAG: tyrosine-type recombinase/integrase, partial [Dehalococcoidia bacterium]|nr:tyrosine-type recombinase/integrase [Dehalococcoidia bacterium]